MTSKDPDFLSTAGVISEMERGAELRDAADGVTWRLVAGGETGRVLSATSPDGTVREWHERPSGDGEWGRYEHGGEGPDGRTFGEKLLQIAQFAAGGTGRYGLVV